MPFKNRTLQLSAILVVVSLGVGSLIWFRLEPKKPAEDKVQIKVFQAQEVTYPTQQSLTGRIEMSGVVVATELATLRAKTAGVLMRLHVQEGSEVRKGQVLAEIDISDLKSRSDEKEAALLAAKTSFNFAQSQHKANADLAAQGFISQNALVSSNVNLSSAEAQFKAAESAAVAHRKLLSDAVLTAPIDGIISKRHALVGEKLSMEQEVLSLVNPGRLEFKTMVDSAASQLLKPGQMIDISLEGLAKPIAGRLERISPGNEFAARALPVFISLSSPKVVSIRPGLMGTATISYSMAASGLTLPLSAIQEEGGKNVVWVLRQGALQRQTVTVGMKDSQGLNAYILDGVKAEDQVLALRFEGLKEGTRYEVKP
jgi:RND family efflux transporter MFP subunit